MNPETFDFSKALTLLKEGKRLARVGWNNPAISVLAQFPNEHSKMTLPYLFMEKFNGMDEKPTRFPLDLSVESIFATDWYVIPENPSEA